MTAFWLAFVGVLPVIQAAPSARLAFEPEQAVLGEPVELVLEITHSPSEDSSEGLGGGFVWATIDPQLDPSWIVFESRRELDDGGVIAGPRTTRRVWRLASLEPGLRRAPDAFRESLEEIGVVLVGLEPVLDVVGVLAEGEDEPRPLRGFPSSLADGAGREASFPWLLVGLSSFVVVLIGALILRRRKPRGVGETPTPLEELARLRLPSEDNAEVVRARETHFALSRLVRESTDANLGQRRSGLTDEEWLAVTAADGGLLPAAAKELTALFARFAAVKYAGERPTEWAVDETFDGAQRVLELVAVGPEEARP